MPLQRIRTLAETARPHCLRVVVGCELLFSHLWKIQPVTVPITVFHFFLFLPIPVGWRLLEAGFPHLDIHAKMKQTNKQTTPVAF